MMKIVKSVFVGILLVSLSGCGTLGSQSSPMTKVSDLVPLPEFMPGTGALYVHPENMPVGPFAAYDRTGDLVSTIYMVSMQDIDQRSAFMRLPVAGEDIVSVDMKYNVGHPGVATPHYHFVMWHVDPSTAQLR